MPFTSSYLHAMIKLSNPQQETLASLARLAGDEVSWVPTAQVVRERLRTKGLEMDGGKSAVAYKVSTEQALDAMRGLIPQLLVSNATSWRMTVAGMCVAGVQMGMFKQKSGEGKLTPVTKGLGIGRNGP
jgi:hypothetical protein